MSVRAQPFFFTALNVDSSPIQNTAVIAQFIGTPPLFYPDSGNDDGVNEGPFTVGATNSSGYTTFSLICPPDTTESSGYYIVTIGSLVYNTSSFSYVSSTPLDFSTVIVAPATGPTTVNMLAQWWQVNATGWQNAFLTIGLEVDGIIDLSDAAVSATDQTTFFADGSGLITAPLIPTSLFRGSIKPKWKAILPSGATYLFVAPDIGGDIFAGASIASGTSIVGPAGPAAATDWYTTTGNMTATATYNAILADATGGNIVVTLPSASTANTPFAVAKKDSSGNTVTISPSGGALIDGSSTKVISTQGWGYVALSDGTNWYTWANVEATVLATTSIPGLVEIDQNPGSGAPIAVTVPSVGAASGVASLDATTHVPMAQVPLLDPAQAGSTDEILISDNTRAYWGRVTSIPTFIDPTVSDNQLIYRNTTSVTTCCIGIIGDDLVMDTYNVPADMLTSLNSAGVVTFTKSNQAVSGSKSSDWLHTGTNYTTAVAAFAAASVKFVIVSLGLNDSRMSVATSQVAFASNLRDLVQHLVAAGYIPILMCNPWVVAGSDSGDFNSASQAFLYNYNIEMNRCVNGQTVLQGDTLAFQHFENNTSELSDGWHMTTTGQQKWSDLWYGCVRRYAQVITQQTTLQPLTLGTNLSITSGVLNATTSGAGTLELTDGSTDLTMVTKITVTGATVGGSSGAATLAISGGGGSTFSWSTKTTTYTITTSNSGILGDATSASFVVTLPTAVGAVQEYTIKKKDSTANTVTVATTSSQTIDGSATFVLTVQYESVTVGSDGSNWYIV